MSYLFSIPVIEASHHKIIKGGFGWNLKFKRFQRNEILHYRR